MFHNLSSKNLFVKKCNQSVLVSWESMEYIESNPSSKNTNDSIYSAQLHRRIVQFILQNFNHVGVPENASNFS